MIHTVADLLKEIKEREANVLSQTGISEHDETICLNYGGLPTRTLNFAAFGGMDVRVVEGRIRKPNGIVSRRLDCMVVTGEPEAVVLSALDCVYPLDKVIAIIEVKRNLCTTPLDHADANRNRLSTEDIPLDASGRVRMGYASLFDTPFPETKDEVSALPNDIRTVYENLLRDAVSPLRIVLSYGKYPDEYALRQGMVLNLERGLVPDHRPTPVPSDLPDLVLCHRSALVKMNGQPYAPPSYEERGWHFYGSMHGYNAVLLLELIWTRIATHLGLIAEVDDHGLEMEPINPLLWARLRSSGGSHCCSYQYDALTPDELRRSHLAGIQF